MNKFKLLFIVLFTMFIMMPFHVFAFQLSVESEGKAPVIIEVEDSDTILAVKSKVEAALKIPMRKQIISYNSNKLEDGRTLGDYPIPKSGSKIQVTLKEELNVIYITFDNPVSGNKPDFLGNFVITNEDCSEKIEINDVKLEWSKLSADMSETTLLQDNDVYEDGSMYLVNSALETNILVDDELEKNNYVLSEEGEIFYNGKALTLGSYFYIGGVKTLNEETDKLIVGKEFPKIIKYTFVTDKETKELVLAIDEWIELDKDGNKVKAASGVVEEGKRYLPSFDVTDNDEFNKYMAMVDIRTEIISEDYYVGTNTYKVVFDGNGGKFKDSDKYVIDEWDNQYADSLGVPTREGYKFIGYFTEKTSGTKFEMILNESGIDSDMTFYAQWELEEEVPKTLDNITNSILIGTISLIGLIGAIIYLKKEIK